MSRESSEEFAEKPQNPVKNAPWFKKRMVHLLNRTFSAKTVPQTMLVSAVCPIPWLLDRLRKFWTVLSISWTKSRILIGRTYYLWLVLRNMTVLSIPFRNRILVARTGIRASGRFMTIQMSFLDYRLTFCSELDSDLNSCVGMKASERYATVGHTY